MNSYGEVHGGFIRGKYVVWRRRVATGCMKVGWVTDRFLSCTWVFLLMTSPLSQPADSRHGFFCGLTGLCLSPLQIFYLVRWKPHLLRAVLGTSHHFLCEVLLSLVARVYECVRDSCFQVRIHTATLKSPYRGRRESKKQRPKFQQASAKNNIFREESRLPPLVL